MIKYNEIANIDKYIGSSFVYVTRQGRKRYVLVSHFDKDGKTYFRIFDRHNNIQKSFVLTPAHDASQLYVFVSQRYKSLMPSGDELMRKEIDLLTDESSPITKKEETLRKRIDKANQLLEKFENDEIFVSKWKQDNCYGITDIYKQDSILRNHLARELSDLLGLMRDLNDCVGVRRAKQEKETNQKRVSFANKPLRDMFETELVSFYQDSFQKFSADYEKWLREAVKNQTKRYQELENQISEAKTHRAETELKITQSKLDKANWSENQIKADIESAQRTYRAEYLAMLDRMAKRCKDLDMDVQNYTIKGKKGTIANFEFFIDDSKDRLIHCRVIIAAETSIMVKPHYRILVTSVSK